MQSKFTLNTWRALFAFFLLTAGLSVNLHAQQYTNGNISTGPTHSTGATAPGGGNWSELQGANSLLGTGANITAGFSIADDFTVPAGPSWGVTKITFFAYSTGFAGPTSPFVDTRVQIYNTDPSVGNPAPIWGDLTTNRFISSTSANVYRTANTSAGTTRLVWLIEADVNVTLAPGTYWVEWAHGNGGLSNFTPVNTVAGNPNPGGNSKQRDFSGGLPGTWVNLIDGATGNPHDQHFIIDYNTGPCAGTPTPGNTISSTASACPGINFNLSLENQTLGSGVTYQWQSSPDGTTWTDISGATNSTLNTNLSATTWYQCNVTCSGNTGTSTPVQVMLTPLSGCYCLPPGTNCTDDDIITNVQISTLNNASTCGTGPPAGYTYFNSVAAPTIYSGAANPITVTSEGIWSKAVAVWIDYNQNGTFEASEFTNLGGHAAAVTNVTGLINIPTTALNGTTRMRVRLKFGTAVFTSGSACTNPSGFGETEDYDVNIQPCVPATITGSPSNTSIVCGANATFTASAAGTYPAYQWEWRPNAATAWQLVPNSGIFSGATTNTLTLTNVSQSYSGWQFRAIVSGGCSAPDFTGFATLTVTPLIATINPSSATICNGTVQMLSLTNTLGNVNLLNEGFDVASPLPAGWASQNNSEPVGTTGWFQGGGVFPANSGATTSHIAANYQNTGTSGPNTISNWLMTPVLDMKNGDVFTFYTRTVSGPAFPDRLQVRMSSNGASTSVGGTSTSVGDFTNLLLDINSSLTTTGYPSSWTQYTVTMSGLTGTVSGRLAFRYFVTDGGPAGNNSDYIGIDDVVYTSTGGIAQGIWTGPAGTMWTDAGATVAYTGTPATTIYVNPATTSTYMTSFNTATPCTATGSVTVNVSQPVTGVVNPGSTAVCVGSDASFSVSASGGPLTYQWQVSTDAGTTWSNIAGQTGTTLNLSAVAQTMNNNRYRAVITAGPCGSVNSGSATLTVYALPNASISAGDLSLAPGQTTTVTGTSSPAAGTNGWVWTLNGQILGGNSNTQLVDVDGMGTYQATVTDVNGCVNTTNQLVIGAEASDKLWIYPNPNSGQFQVRLFYQSNFGEKRVVSVFNSRGQLVDRKEFILSYNSAPYLRMDFDLSKHGRGVYAVKVADTYTSKIVSGLVIID